MTNLLISLTLFLFPYRYLYDSSHRETFESAHSMILSVFASRAQRLQRHPESLTPHYRPGRVNSHADSSGTIHKDLENLDPVMKMVPFYAHCLLVIFNIKQSATYSAVSTWPKSGATCRYRIMDGIIWITDTGKSMTQRTKNIGDEPCLQKI